MKLLKLLLEMPLKQFVIGKMTILNFGPNDHRAASKMLEAGRYHLAFKDLPFDFYVFIGDDEELSIQAQQLAKQEPKAVIFVYKTGISDDYHMTPTPWITMHRLIQDGIHTRTNKPFIPYEKGSLGEILAQALETSTSYVYEMLGDALQMKSVKNKTMTIVEEIDIEAITEVILLGTLRVNYDNLTLEGEKLDAQQLKTLKRGITKFVNNIRTELNKIKPGIYQAQ
jgi:hypothetical protein